MTTSPIAITTTFAQQTADLAVAVPQVVAHRLGRMVNAGANPSAADNDEMQQMCTEKVAAFFESWGAMAAEMFRVQQAFAISTLMAFWMPWTEQGQNALLSTSSQLQAAGESILTAGLAPVHRRALANAERLNDSVEVLPAATLESEAAAPSLEVLAA